jgi:hypothetical protein
MALLSASSVQQDSGTYTLAGADWAGANGSWVLTRKATGGSTVALTSLGSASQNTAPPGEGNFTLNYSDGPSGAGSITGIVFTSSATYSASNGIQLTLPADTSIRTATMYWGSSGTTARLTATLSDGSATAATHRVAAATDAQNNGFISTIQWQAGSASQTLIIKLTTDAALDGAEQVAFQGIAFNLSASGAGSSTQASNISAATGAARVSGSASSTQGLNASVAAGAIRLSGSAASAQASNVSTAAGSARVSGAGASTQAANVSSAAGISQTSGVAASTQGLNTASANGSVFLGGVASSTQAANSSSAAGLILVRGTGASLQAPDVSAASGAIGNIAQGSAASVQQSNTSVASGAVRSAGASSSIQAPNLSVASGAARSVGTAASVQQSDVSISTGAVRNVSAAASIQAPNLSVASGAVRSAGTAASVQQPDASAGLGHVLGDTITGTAASVQQPNVSAATGTIRQHIVKPILVSVFAENRIVVMGSGERITRPFADNRIIRICA